MTLALLAPFSKKEAMKSLNNSSEKSEKKNNPWKIATMGVEILFKNFVGLPFLRFEHRNLTKWFDEVKGLCDGKIFKKIATDSV